MRPRATRTVIRATIRATSPRSISRAESSAYSTRCAATRTFISRRRPPWTATRRSPAFGDARAWFTIRGWIGFSPRPATVRSPATRAGSTGARASSHCRPRCSTTRASRCASHWTVSRRPNTPLSTRSTTTSGRRYRRSCRRPRAANIRTLPCSWARTGSFACSIWRTSAEKGRPATRAAICSKSPD